MIQHHFRVEPWVVRETALDLETLAQTESVFALANGHLGLRANLDEGEPSGLPGSHLAGLYEQRPLSYAETGYGDPEDSQSIVNVTDGRSSACSSRTSHLTFATASCSATNEPWTCGSACLTSEEVVLERAVAGRTSRRIMEGLVYVPEELFSGK
jgi:hypothetical protein